jgi:hypothetical protein
VKEFINKPILLFRGMNDKSVEFHKLFKRPDLELTKEERKALGKKLLDAQRERTFGFYPCEEEDVLRADIKHNSCDIHETEYTYIVMEKVWPGIYPNSQVIQWFKWNPETKNYEEIEDPEWGKGTCNWTIG